MRKVPRTFLLLSMQNCKRDILLFSAFNIISTFISQMPFSIKLQGFSSCHSITNGRKMIFNYYNYSYLMFMKGLVFINMKDPECVADGNIHRE